MFRLDMLMRQNQRVGTWQSDRNRSTEFTATRDPKESEQKLHLWEPLFVGIRLGRGSLNGGGRFLSAGFEGLRPRYDKFVKVLDLVAEVCEIGFTSGPTAS